MSKSITQKQCKVDGCDGIHHAKGYCNKHYRRILKNGNLKITKIYDGRRKDKLYNRWRGAKERCNSHKHRSYKTYGARGIKMSDEFINDFWAYRDYVVSLPNAFKDGYSIDRIDNDKGYCRGNLRWSSPHQQASNTSRNNKNVGVRYSSIHNKWLAEIKIKNSKYKKYFDTEELAIQCRKYFETDILCENLK